MAFQTQNTTRILRLTIEKAKNLTKKDIFGASDPYVQVYRELIYNYEIANPTNKVRRTATKKKTVNPEWNETFEIDIDPQKHEIILDVFDENRLTRDDFLGRVTISMAVVDDIDYRVSKELQKRSERSNIGGTLEFSCQFITSEIQTDDPVNDHQDTEIDQETQLQIDNFYSNLLIFHLYFQLDLITQGQWGRDDFHVQITISEDSLSEVLEFNSDRGELTIPQSTTKEEQGRKILNFFFGTTNIAPGNQNRDWRALLDLVQQDTDMLDRLRIRMDVPVRKLKTISLKIADEPDFETIFVAAAKTLIVPPYTSIAQLKSILRKWIGYEEEEIEDSDLSHLPLGWEWRRDNNGRIFYVNHSTRRTQFERPREQSPFETLDESEEDVSNSENIATFQARRITSIEDDDQWAGHHNEEAEHIQEIRNQSDIDEIDESDEVDEFERSDLGVMPIEDIPVNVIPSAPELYEVPDEEPVRENQRRNSIPLPPGWTMKTSPEGRVFFIDHSTRTTSWIDPRTGEPTPSVAPVVAPSAPTPLARQDSEGLGPLPEGWIEKTLPNGRTFYVDHINQRTTWEDPRFNNPEIAGKKVEFSRNYKYKYDRFIRKMEALGSRTNKLELKVRRNELVGDSFNLIGNLKGFEVGKLRNKLWIIFEGEDGLDYGGLAREWFNNLTTDIFNPYYGLFEYSATDNYTLQINSNSGICNEEHLQYFKFIGRIAGMAAFHKKLINGFFIRPFYSMMLGKTITLEDMESVDAEYYNSLLWIRDNDPECLDLTFQVDDEVFGEQVSKDLVPNGGDIAVTEENKMEYIQSVIQWRFVSRVQDQMNQFMEGFHDVIPMGSINSFDEGELELLLGGIGCIDVKDWRDNTEYKNYNPTDKIILWFWRLVLSFGDEKRSRLLQFVTGTSRVPMNGFAELHGSNGPKKFTIERIGNPDSLPRAHTCFNRIDLPEYRSYAELKHKVVTAIEGSWGFAGVD
eukprot:GFUD01024149.1.p1 GENE.GFUD01024149.1~~GFUD01024149.1.p1  ORF type:complete len:971 (+),score=234.93 GFUD01024149.1:83-2995(+)